MVRIRAMGKGQCQLGSLKLARNQLVAITIINHHHDQDHHHHHQQQQQQQFQGLSVQAIMVPHSPIPGPISLLMLVPLLGTVLQIRLTAGSVAVVPAGVKHQGWHRVCRAARAVAIEGVWKVGR